MNFKYSAKYESLLFLLFCLFSLFLSILIKRFTADNDTNNVIILYYLLILFVSQYIRVYYYCILISVVLALLFNYFFLMPFYSLDFHNYNYILAFILFLFSSMLISTQTNRVFKYLNLARFKEKNVTILYYLTTIIFRAQTPENVLYFSTKYISKILKIKLRLFLIKNDRIESILKISNISSSRNIHFFHIEESDIQKIEFIYICKIIKIENMPIICIAFPKKYAMLKNETVDIKFKKYLIELFILQITASFEKYIIHTEKIMTENQINNERFKLKLLQSISHDFRTPLTSIIGFSDILLEKYKNNDDDRKILLDIIDSSNWLVLLLENILSLSRLQDEEFYLHLTEEPVEEVIFNALEKINRVFPNCDILVTQPKELIFVKIDEKLIIQVLINLVENSVKHSGNKRPIQFLVKVDNNKIWFKISDSGVGIKKSDLPYIFDSFFTSNNNKKNNSTGLGLAICKLIVELHGGEIFAENNLNGGATFKFYINLGGKNEF